MPTPVLVGDVIAALPLPALAVAPDEHIVAMNEHAQKLLGMPVLGRHFMTVLRQPAVVEAVENCLAGTAQTKATFLGREHGNDMTYTVTVGHVDPTGTALLTFQDITPVTAAGQMRRDFVANVSHELRTPLTALMGFIETLQGPARNDTAARERFLKIMQSETERMNRLVSDLLSLSRVEEDERIRPTSQADVCAVMASTLRNLGPLAVEAEVRLVPDMPETPLMIVADADQLVQVFTNLVENAIKYGGKSKRVFVSVQREAHVNAVRGPAVIVCVRDEGPGIDPRHIPRLTERFYRADSHRNRALGGTGLGLAIVKHILNRHRGRMKITSELGHGAEFKVILPIEPIEVVPET